jgi:beta-glucosidase-like glycosyl hydrolase
VLLGTHFAAKAGDGEADPAKVEEVLSQMTFAEKIAEINLGAGGMRCTKPNERLGIPPTLGINGPRGPVEMTQPPVNVCYPVALAMAATWNEALMDTLGRQWGKAMIEVSQHAKSGRNNLFGTGLNTCRHPLAGRNAEYFGEDPLLAGKMGAALSRGVQSTGCVATIKHYAGNDFETGRTMIDILIPERVLRELILKPFEICIKESNAKGIMTGYNKVNGTFCSANGELLRILREDMGFRGIVVSDYMARMESAAAALTAGSNVEIAGNHFFAAEKVRAALDSGALKPEVLDQRIREILRVKLAPDFYDGSRRSEPLTDIEVRRKLARQVAGESFVLLKNAGQLLPLKSSSSVALIGPFADPDPMLGNNGSSGIRPERVVGLKDEIEKRFTGGVTCVKGCGPADKGDGIPLTDFACKAEYFNNLELEGKPVLVRDENSIQKLSFKGGGVAELSDEGVFGKCLLFSGQSAAKLGQWRGWNAREDFAIGFWVNFIDQFPKEEAVVFSLFSPPKECFQVTPQGLLVSTSGPDGGRLKLDFEIPSMKWAHVAIVRKAGELSAYVDGKQVAKAAMEFPFPGTPIYVGGAGNGKHGARAMVEDVRIYKEALGGEQIRMLARKQMVDQGLAFHAACNQAIKAAEDETYPGIEDSRNMSARWTGTITPKRSGKHCFEFISTGGLRVFLDGRKVIDQWGEHLQSGVTLMIWPTLEAGKIYDLRLEFSNCAYRVEVLRFNRYEPPHGDLFAEARGAATGKDVAIVAVGVHQSLLQGEANDNETFELPGYQAELIKEVVSVNPRTVVLLCTAGGVAMQPWIENTPAVLEVFFPGQEAGNSIVDVLLGDVNPSGKLPMTYPVSVDNIPNMVADRIYPDDLCHYGYFLFDKHNLQPQFPFGHGLSYTTFAYEGLKLSRSDGKVKVSFSIKNTGAREGAEVAQIYAGQVTPVGDRPVRSLKGFSKVALKPGESKSVEVLVPEDSLTQWDPVQKKWAPLSGELKIEVGSSSRDIRASQTVSLK